jgi:hypothetical protein
MTEQMQTDATGVIGPSDSDTAPWLNSADEVNALVNQFALDVFDRFAAFGTDTAGFMSWLEGECRALNAIFIGSGRADRPYKTDPIWNTPDKLGSRVVVALGLDCEDDRHAVRDAFMVLADRLTDVMIAHGDEPISQWGWELSALQQRTAAALLGLPLSAD